MNHLYSLYMKVLKIQNLCVSVVILLCITYAQFYASLVLQKKITIQLRWVL